MNKTAISIDNQRQSLGLLIQFKDKLNNYEHLDKIDEMWDMCHTFEDDIIKSKGIINVHEGQIDELKNYLHEMQKCKMMKEAKRSLKS